MLKSYVLCVIKINILLFNLGQVGKMFLISVAKRSPFLSVVWAFYTSQIKFLPNHQCLCGNIEHGVKENASVVHSVFFFSKRVVFTFIIIKPKAKLCFSFPNIGSIITNFASQKVKNLFWVSFKGPILNFKYFPTCFCCKSVSYNYMITHLTSTFPTWFRASNIVRLW